MDVYTLKQTTNNQYFINKNRYYFCYYQHRIKPDLQKNACSNQLLIYLCRALINNTNHEKSNFTCTGFGCFDRCILR